MDETDISAGAERQSAADIAALVQSIRERGERLLAASANYSAEQLARAKAELEDALAAAHVRFDETRQWIGQNARHATETTERYVSENPWKSVALVAALGLVIGLLLGRSGAAEDE